MAETVISFSLQFPSFQSYQMREEKKEETEDSYVWYYYVTMILVSP